MNRDLDLNRRDLMRFGSAGLGAAALATIAAAPAAAQAPARNWGAETDVLVIGYGAAGAATAVAARDAGASVMIIEKQAESGHTSNTRMCLGVFLSPDNVDDTIAYMEVASRVNVDLPESKDIDDDVIRAWAEESVRNRQWLMDNGVADFVVFANAGRDPSWPGNDTIKAYQVKRADGRGGSGVDLHDVLDRMVRSRNVEIRWQTPGTGLITDGSGAVIGAAATGPDGREIAIRAARAVVLTTGGFEYDEAALKTYLPAYPMTFYGNPDNTGDGLRMAQALGADLWHMTVLGGGLKMKFPDFPTAFATNFGSGSYIIVDRTGRRFKAENELGGYSGYWNALVYDTVRYTWPRIPCWFIFDEKRRTAGPIVPNGYGAAGPVGMYQWSADNSAEIERGWIVKGDTLEELAGKIGVDPATLGETVDDFNGAPGRGQEHRYGRPLNTIAPLDTGPFYAAAQWPGLNNTYGGPRRNARAQIVDVRGNPIPRLYSAGELGSIFVQYPQGGANVGECLAFGRIAGANAAAERPWAG